MQDRDLGKSSGMVLVTQRDSGAPRECQNCFFVFYTHGLLPWDSQKAALGHPQCPPDLPGQHRHELQMPNEQLGTSGWI